MGKYNKKDCNDQKFSYGHDGNRFRPRYSENRGYNGGNKEGSGIVEKLRHKIVGYWPVHYWGHIKGGCYWTCQCAECGTQFPLQERQILDGSHHCPKCSCESKTDA